MCFLADWMLCMQCFHEQRGHYSHWSHRYTGMCFHMCFHVCKYAQVARWWVGGGLVLLWS